MMYKWRVLHCQFWVGCWIVLAWRYEKHTQKNMGFPMKSEINSGHFRDFHGFSICPWLPFLAMSGKGSCGTVRRIRLQGAKRSLLWGAAWYFIDMRWFNTYIYILCYKLSYIILEGHSYVKFHVEACLWLYIYRGDDIWIKESGLL